MQEIREEISKPGQRYVDDPVYIHPKKEEPVSRAVRRALGDFSDPAPILIGHDRVRLRWMRPDGKGGLVPGSPKP